jgi:HlyD family secretion protein
MKQTDGAKAHQKARTLRRIAKRTIFALVAVLVVGAIVMTAMPKPVPIEQATLTRGELLVTVDEDGKSRVKDRYIVSTPLAGNVARIELRAGDSVKQGDVLARIVPLRAPLLDARSRTQTEARVAAASAATQQILAQIERAKATLEFAKNEARRYRALFDERAVSQMELDRVVLEERSRAAELTSTEFGSKVAAHELRMARAALGQFEDKDAGASFLVPSPITGRVLKIIQQSEGVVQPGTPLLEIGDPKALEIVVDVLTSDAVHIHAGSPVTIDEWGGEPLLAAVRTVEPSAFTRISALGVDEQRVNAVIDLSSAYEEWTQLGDGYRVEARIEVFRGEASLNLPQSALFRHDGRWAVFVIEAGRAALRTIEIGRRNDRHAEILSGLNEGAHVVVRPSDKVVDGVEVTPF